MQRFTAKEVKPSPGENKPTVIKTEDGSSLSGFSASLKDMKPGTVFECETEIKKGYVNIKGEPVIIQAGNGQTPAFRTAENSYSKEDPAKTASIETMNAITNVMTSFTQITLSGGEPSAILKGLWDRALLWCGCRIPYRIEPQPAGQQKTEAPPRQVDTGTGKTETIPEHFENRGELFTACQNVLGVGPKGICEVLGITDPKNIIDLDEAYQAVKNSLNK